MERLWAPWRMSYLKAESTTTATGCIFCLGKHRLDDEHASKLLVLFSDESAFIMMNRYPYTNGHLMIIPHRHAPDLLALSCTEVHRLSLLLRASMRILRERLGCEGFNLGMNVGRIAGAGIADHAHWHIVPRWAGDTNFMPIMAETRIINQYLAESYQDLKPAFSGLAWHGEDYDLG